MWRIRFSMRLAARGMICLVARGESSALFFNLRMLFIFLAQRGSALLRECFETMSSLSRVVLFVFILNFALISLIALTAFHQIW